MPLLATGIIANGMAYTAALAGGVQASAPPPDAFEVVLAERLAQIERKQAYSLCSTEDMLTRKAALANDAPQVRLGLGEDFTKMAAENPAYFHKRPLQSPYFSSDLVQLTLVSGDEELAFQSGGMHNVTNMVDFSYDQHVNSITVYPQICPLKFEEARARAAMLEDFLHRAGFTPGAEITFTSEIGSTGQSAKSWDAIAGELAAVPRRVYSARSTWSQGSQTATVIVYNWGSGAPKTDSERKMRARGFAGSIFDSPMTGRRYGVELHLGDDAYFERAYRQIAPLSIEQQGEAN